MRVSIFLVLFFISHLSFGQTNIIGFWKGKDNTNMSLNFINTNTVIFTLGKVSQKLNYKIDYTKTPIWLDLIIIDGKNMLPMEGIIEFVDKNVIKWQAMNQSRKFLPEDDFNETLILNRSINQKK
jgi:hypothetical protein